MGYTAFRSLLQWFCCVSLSKSLFTTGAVLASGRAGRSAVQTWIPPFECFTARCPDTTWVAAGFSLGTRSSQRAGAGCRWERGGWSLPWGGKQEQVPFPTLSWLSISWKIKCELTQRMSPRLQSGSWRDISNGTRYLCLSSWIEP